jgi:hypothetical protein
VYYKTGADETEVNAASWALATPDNVIPVSDTGTFSEVEWTINPTIDFKAFGIKLVMKSENPALVPNAAAFRAIALV